MPSTSEPKRARSRTAFSATGPTVVAAIVAATSAATISGAAAWGCQMSAAPTMPTPPIAVEAMAGLVPIVTADSEMMLTITSRSGTKVILAASGNATHSRTSV